MKLLLTLLLTAIFNDALAQCEALTINTLVLNALPNCAYSITSTATLSHGNASLRFLYRCGSAGVKTELTDCFSWQNPSTATYTSSVFNCPCSDPVYVSIVSHASPSCHGRACIEISLTNLALRIIEFKAYRDRKVVCMNWTIEDSQGDDIYWIEHSSDGQNFKPIETKSAREIIHAGKFFTLCLQTPEYREYYRMTVMDRLLNVETSPVVRLANTETSLLYDIQNQVLFIVGPLGPLWLSDLTIYNSAGQKMFNTRIDTNKIKLPILTSGIYYAVCFSKDGHKLVKTLIYY